MGLGGHSPLPGAAAPYRDPYRPRHQERLPSDASDLTLADASPAPKTPGFTPTLPPITAYDIEADYHLHPDLSGRPHERIHLDDIPSNARRFGLRLIGYGRELPSYGESLLNIVTSSWLNFLLPFVPIAWVAHFLRWPAAYVFGLSFVAIIPLEKLFDFGGEEFALYCGKSVGDLVVITLANTVEATLAIILLYRCELKLLQSTIIGVILLHTLLVPGGAFLAGGARIWEQHLHESSTQLNQSLITIGALTLLVPAAFFAALYGNDYGPNALNSLGGQVIANATHGLTNSSTSEAGNSTAGHAEGGEGSAAGATVHAIFRFIKRAAEEGAGASTGGEGGHAGALAAHRLALSDETKIRIEYISRGCAILLLIVYVASRMYLHNPDANEKLLAVGPEAFRKAEEETLEVKPKMRPLVCLFLLIVTVPLTAFTVEILVESVDAVRNRGDITAEWFGIILLPIASFSGDALITVTYFLHKLVKRNLPPPAELAQGRSIDLAIQFVLFWMPALVLLGWWSGKPFTLLFDLFEVAVLIGACFLVNYVTQDSKTNWAEGLIMVVFYVMIAVTAWYYDGQFAIRAINGEGCGSVLEFIEEGASAAAGGH
ncbi:hypothetical protein BOTBODRAFT_58507 [Botryobasidium botryosum FD-172 SS1]|uniref:Sodium/calcium exchanger membrane region domain-containing protein n=1 Tax=Botryobasidium botryosum (strain FD-172 SS1) TaxID=930990 RepID=A0A067M4V5_BOTB1|nr:hypothetical protein BOTBODRAFT_58507 [Botryobasidium botryosum FD-172 SS1]